jgi:hypothetical protein
VHDECIAAWDFLLHSTPFISVSRLNEEEARPVLEKYLGSSRSTGVSAARPISRWILANNSKEYREACRIVDVASEVAQLVLEVVLWVDCFCWVQLESLSRMRSSTVWRWFHDEGKYSCYAVEGGHRAIKYTRLGGVKQDIYAEGTAL